MLIPYKAEDGGTSFPWITVILVGINVAVHVILSMNLGEEACWAWGFVPEEPRLFTLISSLFVHADAMHLLGNMLFLWVYGAPLERSLGALKYLLLYLGFGVAATLFFWMKTPAFSADMPLVGASGAIAGIMGGFFVVHPGVMIRCFVFLLVYVGRPRLPAWLLLAFWFFTQWISGQFISTGVAYEAHIGGFVAGFIVTAFVWHGRGFLKAFKRADIEHVDAANPEPDPEQQYREASDLAADAHDDVTLNFWKATRAVRTGRNEEAARIAQSSLRHIDPKDRKFRLSCHLLRHAATGLSRNRDELLEFEGLASSAGRFPLAARVLERLIQIFPEDEDRRRWRFRLAQTWCERMKSVEPAREILRGLVEEPVRDDISGPAEGLLARI